MLSHLETLPRELTDVVLSHIDTFGGREITLVRLSRASKACNAFARRALYRSLVFDGKIHSWRRLVGFARAALTNTDMASHVSHLSVEYLHEIVGKDFKAWYKRFDAEEAESLQAHFFGSDDACSAAHHASRATRFSLHSMLRKLPNLQSVFLGIMDEYPPSAQILQTINDRNVSESLSKITDISLYNEEMIAIKAFYMEWRVDLDVGMDLLQIPGVKRVELLGLETDWSAQENDDALSQTKENHDLEHLGLAFEDHEQRLDNLHIPIRCCKALTSLRVYCTPSHRFETQPPNIGDAINHLKPKLRRLVLSLPLIHDPKARFSLQDFTALQELAVNCDALCDLSAPEFAQDLAKSVPPQLKAVHFFILLHGTPQKLVDFVENVGRTHPDMRRLSMSASWVEGGLDVWTQELAQACETARLAFSVYGADGLDKDGPDAWTALPEGIARAAKAIQETRYRRIREMERPIDEEQQYYTDEEEEAEI